MPAERTSLDTMTEAIREAIAECELSYQALERETGVLRQSLMKFAAGEQTLRLDSADRLARFFGIKVMKAVHVVQKWTTEYDTCLHEDEKAFRCESRIDEHFGFPYEDVHSITTNSLGRVNIYENRKRKDRPPRTHYLSNLLGIKYVKQKHNDAIVWDERYEWNDRVRQGAAPFDAFKLAFGAERVREVAAIARKRGIKTDNHGRFKGKSDMAVFLPSEGVWRFIEIKHDRRGKQPESWREFQQDWLELMVDYLGEGSAIELRFVDE